MSFLIKILFLITFSFVLGSKVFVSGTNGGEDDSLDVMVEPMDEYGDGMEDEFQTSPLVRQWKRGNYGFWSPHPSDFNPMRRPGSSGTAPRSNKRYDFDNSPYHPVPRSINIKQKQYNGGAYDDMDSYYFDGQSKDKRQSPGSFLLMKLGRINKAGGEVSRKMGRRASLTLPYALKSGSVHVKQGQ